MSYCVHCGVELAPCEKSCPLCHTVVYDPAALPPAAPVKYPYPAEVEEPRTPLRRVTAQLFSLFLLIPLLSLPIADFSVNGSFSWSLIASGGILLFFILFLFPGLFSRPLMWMFLIFDTLAAVLYQFVLCVILRENWWLFPGLPLTLLAGALVIGGYLTVIAKKPSFALKSIILLLSVMLFSINAQIVIDLYVHSVIKLSWSIYIAVGCVCMSIIILIIDRMYHLSDRIRKKIFL